MFEEIPSQVEARLGKMPFANVRPSLDAATDRFTSLESRLRGNDGEFPLLVARSRTRYNWPECTSTVARIMTLDHAAAREALWSRRDYRIAILDDLSTVNLENPQPWIDSVKPDFGYAPRPGSGTGRNIPRSHGVIGWRGTRGYTLLGRHKKGTKL